MGDRHLLQGPEFWFRAYKGPFALCNCRGQSFGVLYKLQGSNDSPPPCPTNQWTSHLPCTSRHGYSHSCLQNESWPPRELDSSFHAEENGHNQKKAQTGRAVQSYQRESWRPDNSTRGYHCVCSLQDYTDDFKDRVLLFTATDCMTMGTEIRLGAG